MRRKKKAAAEPAIQQVADDPKMLSDLAAAVSAELKVNSSTRDSLEVAWRIYDNIRDWTARADSKASIMLALEAAALALVVGLAGTEDVPGPGCGPARWSLGAGILFLCAAVLLAALAVLPQLRGRRLSGESKRNFLYFGHLQYWDAEALSKEIKKDPNVLDQVTSQIVIMSKIVWRKNVWLQWSLYSFAAALVLIAPVLVIVLAGGTL